MAFSPPVVAQLHQSLKTQLEIWMRLKLAAQKAFGAGEPTREQENAFLQLKSDLSRQYRTVSTQLPKDLQFDGESMMEMMKNATTMQYLHNIPQNEKKSFFVNWHNIYINMSRTFGAIEVINEGYYPSLHRDLMVNKEKKSKGKKKKKKK